MSVAETLKTVPETRLRIIALTWELTTEDGQIDNNKAALKATEVTTALEEAVDYVHAVERAVDSLKRLKESLNV